MQCIFQCISSQIIGNTLQMYRHAVYFSVYFNGDGGARTSAQNRTYISPSSREFFTSCSGTECLRPSYGFTP